MYKYNSEIEFIREYMETRIREIFFGTAAIASVAAMAAPVNPDNVNWDAYFDLFEHAESTLTHNDVEALKNSLYHRDEASEIPMELFCMMLDGTYYETEEYVVWSELCGMMENLNV